MAAGDGSTVTVAASRLKREDYKRTKHDTHFSKWQVLIGASDWEDYSQGKEGATRYRVHNLPIRSGPGLYELGVAVSRSGSGVEFGKLDPDDIVVVYLGQADNVRTRLQHYGRTGAHLGNSYATGNWNESETDSPQKATGLFEEIFSRGHSIVFRWAPMKDKKIAERTEAQLLDTFDYAWNKGSNGARRPYDILQKLITIASSTGRLSNFSKRILFIHPSQVGIKIESSKSHPADEEGKGFFQRILKISRSQPRLVSDKSIADEDLIRICGFIMSDAIPCRRPPIPGRKRCQEHKGLRNYASKLKSIAEVKSRYEPEFRLDSGSGNDHEENAACGVNLGDGNICQRKAMPGRKRCEEHKGRRISRCHNPAMNSAFVSSGNCTSNNASSSNESSVDEHLSTICRATLGNGSVCGRRPIAGHKRCWQHKGKRANETVSSGINKTCGVALQHGSTCKNEPVQGRKRCEEHKGMRVYAF